MMHRPEQEEDPEQEQRSWWQFGNAPTREREPWYGPNRGPEIATAIVMFGLVIVVVALAIMGVYWVGTKVF